MMDCTWLFFDLAASKRSTTSWASLCAGVQGKASRCKTRHENFLWTSCGRRRETRQCRDKSRSYQMVLETLELVGLQPLLHHYLRRVPPSSEELIRELVVGLLDL